MAYDGYIYGPRVTNKYSGSTRSWETSLGVSVIDNGDGTSYNVYAGAGWYQGAHASYTTTAWNPAWTMACYLYLNWSCVASWSNNAKYTSYGKTHYDVATGGWTIGRGKSDTYLYFYGYSKCTSSAWPGESTTGTWTVTVPQRDHHYVAYNANGGTGSIGNTTKWYSTSGETGYYETLSNGSGFTRQGYTLVGWNSNSSGTGTSYSLSATYTENRTANTTYTLYAVWEKNIATVETKINGVWKQGEVRVKINGVWKDADDVYVKVNGIWKAT